MNELIEYLAGFATTGRYQQFCEVLKKRTRYITVVLEDIYQSHNASAVLRTADCFGIQDVHIIENRNKYTINPDVALGSSKWLDIHYYNKEVNNTLNAIKTLRKKGYRIVATSPHKNDILLDQLDLLNGKVALFFGTELNGLSATALRNADEYLKIPMFGFTESFNISVSAAIILHHLTSKLRNTTITWKLTEEESNAIKMNWLKRSIKSSDLLVERYLSSKNKL